MENESGRLRQWLHDQLIERDMTQSDLARAIGTSPSRVSAWINGRDKPSSSHCQRIAHAFNVDPDYVLTLAGHRVGRFDDVTSGLDPEVLLYFKNFTELSPHMQRMLREQMRAAFEADRFEREQLQREEEGNRKAR